MKLAILLFTTLIMGSFMLKSQTIMNIHQSTGSVLQIPVNTIDSITYTISAGIVSNPGAGVTFDGYAYSSIVLGNGQEWMSENLRTTVYANGDAIPNVIDANQWASLTTGGWAYYNNDSQWENPFGKLYNWYTVADSRNVCPAFWHVPSEAEWQLLSDYLGGNFVSGGKMKSIGTQNWLSPNTDATNESGFSGHPGGFRSNANGTFGNMTYNGYWWSTNDHGIDEAGVNFLDHSNAWRDFGSNPKRDGLSVRCVKD